MGQPPQLQEMEDTVVLEALQGRPTLGILDMEAQRTLTRDQLPKHTEEHNRPLLERTLEEDQPVEDMAMATFRTHLAHPLQRTKPAVQLERARIMAQRLVGWTIMMFARLAKLNSPLAFMFQEVIGPTVRSSGIS